MKIAIKIIFIHAATTNESKVHTSKKSFLLAKIMRRIPTLGNRCGLNVSRPQQMNFFGHKP